MKGKFWIGLLFMVLAANIYARPVPERVTYEAETLTLTPGVNTSEINVTWFGNTEDGKSGRVIFAPASTLKKNNYPRSAQIVNAVGIDATTGKISHKATLSGLRPNTEYAYSVSNDGVNYSRVYTYRSPAAGSFTFAAVGDPQLTEPGVSPDAEGVPGGYMENDNSKTTKQGWQETIDAIISIAPNVRFIAGVGDQIDRNLVRELGAPEDGSDPHEPKYANFFAPNVLRSVPFAPAMGNHEGRSNSGFIYHYNLPNEQNFTPVDTGRTASSRHEMEAKGNYFYLYNDALFVVLSTAPYPRNINEAAQIINGHFDETFKAATEKYAGQYQWLFVQTHKSIASLADHAADTDIQYYVEAGFKQLMDRYRVDFVLAGHDHIYARSYPMHDGKRVEGKSGNSITDAGGTVYFTLNSSSGQKFYEEFVPDITNNTEYPYFDDGRMGSVVLMEGNVPYIVNFYHQDYKPMFVKIDVTRSSVTFNAYEVQDDLTTKVIDTYTVTKSN